MSEISRYTCREYREEMLLLGLRRRLAADSLTENERKALEEQARQLEDAMQMD